MKNFNYCNTCILPYTRPNLFIDEKGICNACKSSREKTIINWDNRKRDFEKIIKKN